MSVLSFTRPCDKEPDRPYFFRRSLLCVRVKRGADILSDHHLVTAAIKLNKNWTEKERRKPIFNINFLNDETTQGVFNLANSYRNRKKLEVVYISRTRTTKAKAQGLRI